MSSRQFTITYDNGKTETVPHRDFDMVKLERHLGKPMAKIAGAGDGDGDGWSMEAMFFLAYVAAVRGKSDAPSFDDWGDTVAEIDASMFGADEDDAAPLDRTA